MLIERGYDPDIVGEDVVELTFDDGIDTGMAIGILLLPRGEPSVECGSRRWGIEGETARRFEAGYGSKRSSNLRFADLTALVVGGGVYLHWVIDDVDMGEQEGASTSIKLELSEMSRSSPLAFLRRLTMLIGSL